MGEQLPAGSRWPGKVRAIVAVAGFSVRAAIRSRVVIALVLLLVAGVIGIPQVVTGDGSPASELQVRLHYTLATSVVVLGLATLWASCAAFGLEIDSRRIELTAVKPVQPWMLWLGRWLGILLLDAVLLAGVAVGVRMQVAGCSSARAPDAAAADPLVSRALARPLLPTAEDEARQLFAQLQQNQRLPADEPPDLVLRKLIVQSRYRYQPIQPGESAVWRFHLAQPVPSDGRCWVRMRFDTGGESLADVRGFCRVRRAGATTWAVEIPVNDLIRNELELPITAVALAQAAELEVGFFYNDQDEGRAAPLLVQPRTALAVLTPLGSFNGNLARVVVAQLAILAALAALGLTLGACFSFPVAAFVATAVLLVVLVTPEDARELLPAVPMAGETESGWVASVAFGVNRTMAAVVRPLMQPEPLAQVVSGERVPAAELWRMWLWGMVVYPLALALLASGVLRRRELARQMAGG
jgi:hypothetical protein